MDKITKGYIIIISICLILCIIPVIIFFEKVEEYNRIFLFMLMFVGWIYCLLSTPYIYKKTFGRKDLIIKIDLNDIKIN